MKPTTPARKPRPADQQLAIVEAMVGELEQLRAAEADKDLRDAYMAAMNRLGAIVHRLRQPRPLVIGRPPRLSPMATVPAPVPAPVPEPPPSPPQRALPLGPVVVARKPRRR